MQQIHPTLTADRETEDVNIYESLRDQDAGNELSDAGSMEGTGIRNRTTSQS